MPKQKNVTNADIEHVVKSGYDISSYAFDFAERIMRGNVEPIDEPIGKATALLSASRALADLASRILHRSSNDEQAQTLERELRSRHEKAKANG